VRPIFWPNGDHDFNEVVFEDVDMPANHLLGEEDNAWAQATAELAYERSGPERFLETIAVLIELVNLVGPSPDSRAAEGLGRLVAQLFTMRRMSISVAGMLAAGKEPVLEASIVKDLGTVWMQKLPGICRDLGSLIDNDPAARSRFEMALTSNLLIAPKLTIQGGTTEILRGIIARGLGLR
jgi:alkylation response protein AidB-like acyl-CoA dehydrogenase